MTTYKLVPVEPTEEMLRAPFHGRFSNDADQIRMKHIYKAMLAAAPEPASLPDDVAMLVDIMRNRANCGVDGCKEAADMLESMSRELSVVQEENVKLRVQQIEYVGTSAEQQAKNEELREHMRELAAVKAELETAKGLLRDGRYPELCQEMTELQTELAACKQERDEVYTDSADTIADLREELSAVKAENEKLREDAEKAQSLLASIKLAMENDMADPHIMIGCDWTHMIAAIDAAISQEKNNGME